MNEENQFPLPEENRSESGLSGLSGKEATNSAPMTGEESFLETPEVSAQNTDESRGTFFSGEKKTIASFGENPVFDRTSGSVFDELKKNAVPQPIPEIPERKFSAAQQGSPEIHNPAFTSSGIPVPQPAKKRNKGLIVLAVLAAVVGITLLIWSLILATGKAAPETKDPVSGEIASPASSQPSGASLSPQTNSSETGEAETAAVSSPASDRVLSAADVIEKAEKSVVIVNAVSGSGYRTAESMGSGIILSEDGKILTNAHVVTAAERVSVTLLDGAEYSAEVLGSDDVSDIAVLKIEASGLPAAEFGDSSLLRKGDEVIAIGHPYSEKLAYTATKGMISNLHEDFRFESLGVVLDLIQHDATINMGNSGGPLVDMNGRVIGINSVKISGDSFENICFAIQINFALEVAESLIENGSVKRPVLGVQCKTDSAVGGALVMAVAENGPAGQAGILAGDIITKLNGERLRSVEEFISRLSAFRPGDSVKITVLRDTDPLEFDVVLVESGSVSYEEQPAD